MATGRLPGQSPGLQVIRWSKAPTAGTTTLSGLDDYSVGLTYTAGYESVYLNGVLLDRTTDYTATNGTTIVLGTATVAGDIVNVFGTQISPVNGSVPNSNYTTKGDILAASGVSQPVRLGVGTNTQLLSADSTTATGLKWTDAPSSGGMTLISSTALTGASITFSSIPSTYKDLYIYLVNFAPSTDSEYLAIRYNSDTGSNYGSTTSANTNVSKSAGTFGQLTSVTDNTDNPANVFIQIPNYASSTNPTSNFSRNNNTPNCFAKCISNVSPNVILE
jgi:hypothetical protein